MKSTSTRAGETCTRGFTTPKSPDAESSLLVRHDSTIIAEAAIHGYTMELRYLRDTDKREVGFVVLRDRKPILAVECKSGERGISQAVRYFSDRPDTAFLSDAPGLKTF
jgi:hypothetical protein